MPKSVIHSRCVCLSVGGLGALICLPGAAWGRDLRDLLGQFQAISSVHFGARVEAVIQPAPTPGTDCCELVPEDSLGKTIPGDIVYWADGDNYRMNSYMDPTKFPGMDTQVAYDGEHFQLLRLSAKTLSFSTQDNSVVLPMIVNPLLELIQFRYPVTDGNAHLRLRLKDVVDDQVPESFWNVQWTTVQEGNEILERAEFPGGMYEGREYVHHVYVLPGFRDRPVRIERVTANGPITISEFSDYFPVETSVGPTHWPKNTILRGFYAEGNEGAKLSFTITDFSLDADLPQGVFTISTAGVERVWDDDLEQFVP